MAKDQFYRHLNTDPYQSGGTFSNNINFAINAGATVDFGTSVLDGSTVVSRWLQPVKSLPQCRRGIPSHYRYGAKTYNSGVDYEFRGALRVPLPQRLRQLRSET